MNPKISIVLPCRDEENAIEFCLKQIFSVIKSHNLDAEVIVSDSSSDKSSEIASKFDVVLVKHDKIGYGNAYLEGFKAACGEYIIMGDCDGTYDFRNIPRFVKVLDSGADFVMGHRKKIDKGAMPSLHKYVGNPLLSFVLRSFFGSSVKDSHCGMRAIRKDKLEKLGLRTTGMEFASEMVIKAVKSGLKIKEIPIKYHKRIGSSKLHSFSDGWKHLRFMLLYSPLHLFLFPGLGLFLLGVFLMYHLYMGFPIFGVNFGYHPMFLTCLLIVMGYQLMIFALFAKTYAVTHLGEDSATVSLVNRFLSIERAGLIGVVFSLVGFVLGVMIIVKWVGSGFGELSEIKLGLVALTLFIVGVQTVFSSFMLSILGIRGK